MKYDAVIIGSGVSGMCAALLLARHGRRVAMVERCQNTAPLLRCFRRHGLWCDPGFHYAGGLHPSGPLSVIFRYLGLSDLIRPIALDPNGYDFIQIGDLDPFAMPVGLEQIREALSHRFTRSSEAIAAYLDRIEAIQQEPLFGTSDRHADTKMREAFVNRESLTEFLTANGAEPALQHMLSYYGYCLCGVYGHECPMTRHAMVVGPFYYSAHSLAGGGDSIIAAFERRLREAGVDSYTGQAVLAIDADEHRCLRGVRLADGELLDCQECISTIHPHLLLDLLPDRTFRTAFVKRVRSMQNTPGVYAVFLDSDAPPKTLARSNYYYCDKETLASNDKMTNYAALSWGEGDERRCLSVLRPCEKSPHFGIAASGKKTVEEREKEEVDRTLNGFFHHFPDQRGRCRILDVATPGTYESYTGTVGGSAYGLKHTTADPGLTARTSVKGLCLAGQSVLAPGVLGALVSGILAVCQLVGYAPISEEVRQWQ